MVSKSYKYTYKVIFKYQDKMKLGSKTHLYLTDTMLVLLKKEQEHRVCKD